jgi:hypothetical protein
MHAVEQPHRDHSAIFATTNSSAPSKIIFCSVWLAGRHSGIGLDIATGFFTSECCAPYTTGLDGLGGRRRGRRRRSGLGLWHLRLWRFGGGLRQVAEARGERPQIGRALIGSADFAEQRNHPIEFGDGRLPALLVEPPLSHCCNAGARHRAATACALRRRTSEDEATPALRSA